MNLWTVRQTSSSHYVSLRELNKRNVLMKKPNKSRDFNADSIYS
jgi:hypothetical protein